MTKSPKMYDYVATSAISPDVCHGEQFIESHTRVVTMRIRSGSHLDYRVLVDGTLELAVTMNTIQSDYPVLNQAFVEQMRDRGIPAMLLEEATEAACEVIDQHAALDVLRDYIVR